MRYVRGLFRALSLIPAEDGWMVKHQWGAVSQFRVCILSKHPAFEVLEDKSYMETLFTASPVVKCDSLAFGAFPGCITRCFTLTSRFLPPRPMKVTIHVTRCCHFLFFFLLFQPCKEFWDMQGHEARDTTTMTLHLLHVMDDLSPTANLGTPQTNALQWSLDGKFNLWDWLSHYIYSIIFKLCISYAK